MLRQFIRLVCLSTIFKYGCCQCTSPKACSITIGDAKVSYAGFGRRNNKAFTNAAKNVSFVTGTREEREKKCLLECTKKGPASGVHVRCQTANLSPYKENEPSFCQTSRENVYTSWGWTKDKPGWTQFHVINSFCESNKCVHKTYCIPDYGTDGGTCKCSPWYSGTLCDTFDWRKEVKGYWSFNNGTLKNEGTLGGTLDGINTNGRIIHVPDRRSKVMYCDENNCFKIAEQSKCLNFGSEALDDVCPSGFTLMFWFRCLHENTTVVSKYYVPIPAWPQRGVSLWSRDQKWHATLYSTTQYDCMNVATNMDAHRKWIHIAMVYHQGSLKCYLNGDVLVTSTVQTNGNSEAKTNFVFGEINTKVFWDDIAYFEDPLNQNLVKRIYDNTRKN